LRGLRRSENLQANLLGIEVKNIPSFSGVIKAIKNKNQRDALLEEIS